MATPQQPTWDIENFDDWSSADFPLGMRRAMVSTTVLVAGAQFVLFGTKKRAKTACYAGLTVQTLQSMLKMAK